MGGLQASPRQEPVHLLSSPSGFQPMPGMGSTTQPKRELPGGGRLAWYHKLALGCSDSFS